jgi:hypothetical protein
MRLGLVVTRERILHLERHATRTPTPTPHATHTRVPHHTSRASNTPSNTRARAKSPTRNQIHLERASRDRFETTTTRLADPRALVVLVLALALARTRQGIYARARMYYVVATRSISAPRAAPPSAVATTPERRDVEQSTPTHAVLDRGCRSTERPIDRSPDRPIDRPIATRQRGGSLGQIDDRTRISHISTYIPGDATCISHAARVIFFTPVLWRCLADMYARA